MSRPMRDLVATILVMVVAGLALPIGVLIAMWYLPVPRTWWSLTIFVINFGIPAAAAVVGVRRLRRLRKQIQAERTSQPLAD